MALQVECPNMFNELRRYQLDIFFEVPEEDNVQLVREFYANLLEHENGVVTVRNTPVNASLDTIRRVYMLPVFRGEFHPYRTFSDTRALWGTLLDTICVSDGEHLWIKHRITLNSHCLNWEAKCWLTIVNSWLLSSSNTTDVNLPRASAIHCFMSHSDFDVARLIHEEMLIRSPELTKGHYFPSLITRLCRIAKVPENPRVDGRLPLKAPLRAKNIGIGREPVVNVDDSDDDSVDDDDDAEVAAVPPPPRVDVAAPSQSCWSTRMTALEQDMAGLRTSVTDLGARVDAVAERQVKSKKKFLGWLRALGRACNVNPDTISDQEWAFRKVP